MPPMNLEYVEALAVKFLEQTGNPMVPLSTLLRHLRQDEECAGLSEHDLLSFLRENELFTVLELNLDEEEEARREEAGVPIGPRVILKTRIPTKAEFGVLIEQQLEKMAHALGQALDAAEDEGRTDAAAQVRDALDRAKKLRDEFKKLF